jgi:hypothetical protein
MLEDRDDVAIILTYIHLTFACLQNPNVAHGGALV